MQQNKKFLRVLCSLLAAALAAWCTVLLCRWVGYDLQERLGNTPSYEIINDDYSQIIDIPAEGLTQAMPLKAGQPFYGVRFKFSTHGQLYKSGMTMVEAYNETGEQILFAAGNFLNIWDDTFTEFTCNEAYISDHDETLTIRLYNESAWDGPLGVWASEGEVSGMPLSVMDGDNLNATMAMQRVSDFTGSWPAALVVGAAGGVYAVSHMGGGLDPDQLTMTYPNGDSIWTFSFGYICRNIPATVKLLLRTLPEQGALWLQGLLGTTLGEPIVYRIDVSWLLGVGLLLAVLAAALPRQDEPALLGRRSKAGTAGICLCVVLAVLAAALNWTPINYQTLFGLQGRYLLPILPLALLLVKSSKKLALRRDVAHAAALCTSTLTMLTLLQGFGLYAAWQPVS